MDSGLGFSEELWFVPWHARRRLAGGMDIEFRVKLSQFFGKSSLDKM